jgi:hypothetical protein
MATRMRAVPLTCAELTAAIEGGVYPHERSWIDFKRRLYPENGDAAARDKVSQELARDMASMAECGGYLIYGVKENKVRHTFTVDEMPLPVGLHETVDAVARDRITPPLAVVPTLVPDPETGPHSFAALRAVVRPDQGHSRQGVRTAMPADRVSSGA